MNRAHLHSCKQEVTIQRQQRKCCLRCFTGRVPIGDEGPEQKCGMAVEDHVGTLTNAAGLSKEKILSIGSRAGSRKKKMSRQTNRTRV